MSTFYLVRHAHAVWTPDEHRPLSARGSLSALRVAHVLCPLPIASIYSSPERRAHETIEPLAARLGLLIHTVADLRERRLGDCGVEDYVQAVEATWRDASFAHPGGESNAAAQQRGISVLRGLQKRHPGEQVVLSTHGTLLALMLQHFDSSVDLAFWRSLTMPDIYRLAIGAEDSAAIRRLWGGVV